MQTTEKFSFFSVVKKFKRGVVGSSVISVSFFIVSALVRGCVGELKKRTNGLTDSQTNSYNLCVLCG